ncbi:MAG: DUF3857 domain-containing protein, partial [Planctomycetes bacterium]|nr:DUF3857 domain-containing protein [Planctomycetota bacterium]
PAQPAAINPSANPAQPAPAAGVAEKTPLVPGIVLLDRAASLARARAATAEKYPDADEVLASAAVRVDYRADGTYTQLDEAYVKILTEKGRRNNLTISSYFTIPYQREGDCLIPLLEIVKADGRVVTVNVKEQGKLTVDAHSMGANIYNPNDKLITVNVAGLEVGDTLHYVMWDHIRQPRAAGIFADFFALEQVRPIVHKEIAINGPKGFPLKSIALRDEIPGTVKAATSLAPDGSPRYRWVVDNVPQAFPEPNMPPLYMCAQRLMVSTAANWEEVSAWYARLCAPALAAVSPEMRQEVARIVAGAAGERQKTERVFAWVSQQIRYMGVTTEKTAPGYEPHPVKDTFAARHGVCRDKAALLVAMLRLAGVEAYPVLIHTEAKKDAEVPQPYFNHAITAAKIDGALTLMDATDENTRELLPAYLNDKSYLVAADPGQPLRLSPITPAAANMMDIETTGALDDSGNLTAETVMRFGGINDNAYRGYFSRVTPEERRSFFESRVKGMYGDAKLLNWKLTPENPQDISRPLEARLQFEARNILTQGRALAMLPLPFLGSRVGMANFALGKAGLEKRRFPLVIGSACGVRESLKIDLPADLDKDVSMPVYKPLDNPGLGWSRSVARVGKSLLGKSEFVLKTVEYSPAAYRQLKDDLKVIEYNQRKQPVFAQGPQRREDKLASTQVDSLVVRDDSEVELLDAHSWRERRLVRRKILTYAGLKEESEIRVSYNPAFEEVKLESATVIAPNGKMQNIGEHEINVMDQEWNAAAPRYPGGKILVASLPGVEIGSIIEYRIMHEVRRQPVFQFSRTFRDFNPIARRTVVLRAPDYDAVASHATRNLAFEETVDGARMWAVDNQPQVKVEDHLPPWASFTPVLFLGAKITWADYASMVRAKIAAAAAGQAETAAKGKKFFPGDAPTLAGMRAFVDWLATTVRLAGPEFSRLPLEYLTPADRTLKDGYGNTTDRAALLLAALAPFQPELFLVSALPQAENLPLPQLTIPGPAVFNRVLLRLRVEGRTVWLNDINQYDELGATPSEGMLALNLGTGRIEAVEVDKPFIRVDETACRVELQPDGTALVRIAETVSGARYGAMKKMFAEMRPEQRRRHHQSELAALAQSAEPVGDYVTDFTAYPGKVSFAAKIDRYAVADGSFLYFTLPRSLGALFNLRSAQRDNPLYRGQATRKKIATTIVLPPDMQPMVFPNRYLWQSPVSRFDRVEVEPLYGIGVSEGKNILRVNQSAALAPSYYVPALYPELLKVQAQLVHSRARTVLLAAKKWLEVQKLLGK